MGDYTADNGEKEFFVIPKDSFAILHPVCENNSFSSNRACEGKVMGKIPTKDSDYTMPKVPSPISNWIYGFKVTFPDVTGNAKYFYAAVTHLTKKLPFRG